MWLVFGIMNMITNHNDNKGCVTLNSNIVMENSCFYH